MMIKDARSNAYQLLTAGDPSVVTSLCHEAWQGENSTILPLASADRATILDTSRSWKLADLDVTAFSYSPVPYTVEKRLGTDSPQESKVRIKSSTGAHCFLLIDMVPVSNSDPISKRRAISLIVAQKLAKALYL